MLRTIKRFVRRVLSMVGYEIRRIQRVNLRKQTQMAVYQYVKEDGMFDYEGYRLSQTAANKRKIEAIWVLEGNVEFLANYIKKIISAPTFGICHGTRRGNEQTWFRKYLGCNVIGTEISDTAEEFPDTIQWDFHEVKPEWIDSVDFIYSNSFDHTYDPQKCLNAWMSCVRKGGLCIIEHTSEHSLETVSARDPFEADLVQMPYLITLWGEGRYGVREMVKAPETHPNAQFSYFLIIQKF